MPRTSRETCMHVAYFKIFKVLKHQKIICKCVILQASSNSRISTFQQICIKNSEIFHNFWSDSSYCIPLAWKMWSITRIKNCENSNILQNTQESHNLCKDRQEGNYSNARRMSQILRHPMQTCGEIPSPMPKPMPMPSAHSQGQG